MQNDFKDNLFYNSNKTTFDNAKSLRKELTNAEELLWQRLRGRKFQGLKFRRQHPIGKYIADFYCHELKFVVEVDGSVHEIEEQKEYDVGRTFELNKMDIKVIRFTNNEIEREMSRVLSKLNDFIKGLK